MARVDALLCLYCTGPVRLCFVHTCYSLTIVYRVPARISTLPPRWLRRMVGRVGVSEPLRSPAT